MYLQNSKNDLHENFVKDQDILIEQSVFANYKNILHESF